MEQFGAMVGILETVAITGGQDDGVADAGGL